MRERETLTRDSHRSIAPLTAARALCHLTAAPRTDSLALPARRRRRACVLACAQATRQIRAMGVTTPIVGLSSDTLPPDVDAFIKAGADDFTPKVTH
jgi:DNA-binding NarL/FixJ family response regulator